MSLAVIEDLPIIQPGERPKVILLGNGINRAFQKQSWREMIEDALSRNQSPYTYSEIEALPATMQIVVACGNNGVKQDVQKIAKQFAEKMKEPQSPEERELLRKLLSLPVDAILTTNYTMELEQAAEGIENLYQFRCHQRLTRELTKPEKESRLFQCSKVNGPEGINRIWHIHGDISTSNSVVVGHYYYGKLQTRIHNHERDLCRSYKISIGQHKPFRPVSWVDYFLLGDVYAFGIGMSPAEQDLWWLLACKQLKFPNTAFYYFEPERSIDGTLKKMLKAYGATLCTSISRKENQYIDYYGKVINSIQEQLSHHSKGTALEKKTIK